MLYMCTSFFNEQGEILSQDNCQYQFNVNINYLDYYIIISACTHHWKRVLRDKHNKNNTRHYWLLHKKQHVCKYIYSDMVAKLSRYITATDYRMWKTYFSDDLDVERWTNAFIIIYKSISYTKIQTLQLCILHY